MSDRDWEKAAELFHEALQIDAHDRAAYLAKACEGNSELRREVESLIRSSEEASTFLESPAVGELVRERPEWALENGSRVSHYKIVEPIGAGGMGEVYLADDERLGRRVALKVLTADTFRDEGRLQRFEREATAVSALNHPNILTIYDFQFADEVHFFASEFIKGITLREKLDNGRLPIIEALEIVVQISSALHAAHEAGVIHRDIKPENVMIREDGYVKVLDFGLAKVTDQTPDRLIEDRPFQSFSLPGMIMGTVTYMSPEQARGNRVDARSDIFSLGILTYEMLAGRPPFQGESTTDVLAQILNVPHQPVGAFRNDVPAELEKVVDKALRKKASDRYRSIADFHEDLKRVLKQAEFRAALQRAGDPSKATTLISAEPAVGTARDVSRSYLPGDLSPLVGREAEISDLTELIAGRGNRLVTLTGIGGTGKTRLAQEMCLRMDDKFADGFIFIRLSDVRDPLLVPVTMAQQARVQEIVGTPIAETVKDFLRDRESLVVLDNFEQIMDAAPFVSDLLSTARNISILVTSRERLHLQAEIEYNVPPLPVPECNESISLNEVSKFDSVRLFVERARHVDPDFQLIQENAPAIAKICAMLDGLPLAIELAAARARVFSPSTILENLQARLAFLTGGARDLPERQQTIRSTVEWSYDLLTDDEKRLFRRLSVFASRFTPSTAEAIVSDIPWKPGDKNLNSPESVEFLDLFASLADKNLLVRRRTNGGEAAYRLLEIVREYAESVLEKDDDADRIRHCHAKYFLDLAENAEPHLQKRESAAWIDRLEEEHDNLRAALQWSIKNQPQVAARLAAAIKQFWSIRGHLSEGIGWAEQILGLDVELPPSIEWKLLTLCGNFTQFRGDIGRAKEFYERSLDAARRSGEQNFIAKALRGLGALSYLEHDLERARSIVEEAMNISQNTGDDFGTAAALARLGDIAHVAGDRKAAIKLASESLEIFRRIGYLEGISAKLYNLGAFVFLEGDLKRANQHFEEAYAAASALKEKINTRLIFDGFAALATEEGDYTRAARLSGAAESYGTTVGYFIEPGEKVFRDAYIGKLKAAISESEFEYERDVGRRMSDEDARRLILEKDKSASPPSTEANDRTNEPVSAVTFFQRPAVIVALLIMLLVVFGIAALWLLR